MKKLRKMLALLLSLTMVLAMGLSVSAEGDSNSKYSITIKNGNEGHTYSAYQIFEGNLSADGEGKKVLSNIKWGDGVNTEISVDEKKLMEAVKEIEGFNACSDASDVAKALIDNKKVDEFAAVVAKYTSSTAQGTANAPTERKYTISNLDAGYYLVKDVLASDKKDDAVSKFMLEVVGDANVEPKSSVPSVEKKVQEKNDSTSEPTKWQDAADYDIGDRVPFQLTGTMPSTLDDYTNYSYSFVDTLSEGLTFNMDSVKVYLNSVAETNILSSDKYTVSDATYVTGESGPTTFSVSFENVKNINNLTADSKIIVEYTATLNENAVIGTTGNSNKVSLTYSNNPYGDGTGTTPEDEVIVFTYKLTVNKVDEDGTTRLTGAGFTLYKWDSSKSDEDRYVEVKKYNADSDTSTFTFTGLDAGQYKLVESEVPSGHNKAEDIEFIVKAVYNKVPNTLQHKSLGIYKLDGETCISNGVDAQFFVEHERGNIATTIVNSKGSVLPSTGGIGTTIFYVIGGILMVGAGVILISRKRMDK